MNMFKSEFECVATCIFTARAEPKDYHNLNQEEFTEGTTMFENQTVTETTGVLNSTGPVGNLTTVATGNGTVSGNGTGGNETTTAKG